MYTSVQLHIAAKCTKLPSYQMRQIPVHAKYLDLITKLSGERSGSVVECLTRDRGAAGLSLTGVIALCPLARTLILA